MYILGVSAYYHDAAACILKGSKIIAAAQEERFTRKRHDPSFPKNAIKYCLKEAGIDPDEVTNVVFYEKPFLKFERLLETYLAFAPKGFKSFSKSMPVWMKEKLFQKSLLVKEISEALGNGVNWKERLLFSEHHLSHAASAFYPSPFKKAAVLTIDGVGEWTTTSCAVGNEKNLSVIKEIQFPHSIGLLYSAFTYYTGFRVNSGEYKVMGLAPYGVPKYVNLIKENLINLSEDGTFQLNMEYFDFATGLTMTNESFDKLFGGGPRVAESNITQREMDLAASVQKVVEDVIVSLAKNISKETGERNLCLAGGVALNCVANGILHRENIFDQIWIQPASGDAGGALGAALSVYHLHYGNERLIENGNDAMHGAYLGPQFDDSEIEAELIACGAKYEKLDKAALIEKVACDLSEKKAIGWMQGRMEFGPRALGNRSIIADPRSSTMQNQLNLKVKYRESFRPFAPSILRENVDDWFEYNSDSPYMLFVANVRNEKRCGDVKESKDLFGIEKLNFPRSVVPAITHVDYSARIQTVHHETNPLYHELISKFKEKTGCPLVVNTSFNVRGEPIICSPTDAFKCFMGTELDTLAIGNFYLSKDNQYDNLQKNYDA